MTERLTDEMRQALRRDPERLPKFEDDETRKMYVLVPTEEFAKLLDRKLREELQIGFDQVERGEVATWSLKEFLRRMHRSHAGSDTA